LHGVARVREKLHHWENVVLLGDAFKADPSCEIIPLQLPCVDKEYWLGMEFPPGTKIESDRLLYTAHFDEPFDRTKSICGLLEYMDIEKCEKKLGVFFELLLVLV
jgi:hypothetical protein